MAGEAASPPKISARKESGVALVKNVSDSEKKVLFWIGNYGVLREINRGGMGVVYLACQRGLKRVVALKMTLAGQFAGEEERKRFCAEAEAAGQLDHPHIVPIFEVGEHEGQPYFSMGYVEGVSLKQMVADGPLPSRQAAELMRTIAGAVQYAHARGIVHRDLKPANVLLDTSGQPRVTDFGLAKRVAADSSLTATGQALGTPSFMPPEQALGRSNTAGPLSDVYSLGATLYCLLTGRPPFQAATVIDTMLQVVQQEPISPRQLDPTIPADLETIALKCLEKRPEARYDSAASLAEDLERWLNELPIQARPISAAERTWRWMKRNRTLTALIASLVVGVGVSTVSGLGWRDQWLAAESANATVSEQRDTLRTQSDELKAALTARNVAFENLSEQAAAEDLRRGIEECNTGSIDHGVLVFARALRTVPKAAEALRSKILLNIRAWLPRMNRLEWHQGSALPMVRMALSPDETLVAITEHTEEGFVNEQTRIVEMSTGRTRFSARTHPTKPTAMAFRPTGQKVVFIEGVRKTGDQYQAAQREWDLQTGADTTHLMPVDFPSSRCVISPNGSLAALGSQKEVQLWNLDQRSAGPVIFRDANLVNGFFDFTPDSRFVVFRPFRTPSQPSLELSVWDVVEQKAVVWKIESETRFVQAFVKDQGLVLSRAGLWWLTPATFPAVSRYARWGDQDAALRLVAADPRNELFAVDRFNDGDLMRIWNVRPAGWMGQPLSGRIVQIGASGDRVVAATDRDLRAWRLAGRSAETSGEGDPLRQSLAKDPEQFGRLVELATGKRLDERGQFVLLSAGEWDDRSQQSGLEIGSAGQSP
jgi:serine/threonine protein kinase